MDFYSDENPKEITKSLYRDEINLTVRAQIQVVMDALRNPNSDIIDHGALADVLFVAMERWERLDRFFDEHEQVTPDTVG